MYATDDEPGSFRLRANGLRRTPEALSKGRNTLIMASDNTNIVWIAKNGVFSFGSFDQPSLKLLL